ncbi:MAG: hemerythrin domain-containing protein [Oligoflexia bacterium]|nr:hemerythrin domain-containing protein [Oligoflexia bacterium]
MVGNPPVLMAPVVQCFHRSSKETLQMNALDLLKEDHQNVSELLDQIEQFDEIGQIKRLFRKIRQQLDTHAYIEETVFYLALKDKPPTQALISQSLDDHREMRVLLAGIAQTSDPVEVNEKLRALVEVIENHVKREERDLFPKVREVFTPEELDELGERLESARGSAPGLRAVA